MAVEPEVFSDGVWIGIEAAAPKAINDEDSSRAVQSFFFGAEFNGPAGGRDGPDLKETGRDTEARVTFSGSAPVDSRETSSRP